MLDDDVLGLIDLVWPESPMASAVCQALEGGRWDQNVFVWLSTSQFWGKKNRLEKHLPQGWIQPGTFVRGSAGGFRSNPPLTNWREPKRRNGWGNW